VGRIAAEMLTPYRLTGPVLGYLRSGVQAGMVVPDAADTTLAGVRVMTE
jgi:arginine decarboxylase